MAKVRLAFLWHMHQPLYREPERGDYLMPWVRLHATRAYYDMAWALERHPGVRCTVNFTPVLLEQLEEYARGEARDRFVELTARPAKDLEPLEVQAILRSFFMVDWDRNVRPLKRYWELLGRRGRDIRGVDLARVAPSFSEQDVTDLQVLFNLAWVGFGALADDAGLRALREKGRDFGRLDVEYLLSAQRRILAEIVPRWRRLAERGQVELSTTPYFHPILPLVVDSDAARRALPHAELPPRFAWPEDARWHVREAMETHARRFGRAPAGMWPAEGSVSPEALELLRSEGVRWAASDEGVLLHSVPHDGNRAAALYRPWRVSAGGGELRMLFRDRPISDLVGFTYARTPAKDAVADLVGRVREAGAAYARSGRSGPATVGVFLDGENAWEHYPSSGREFLDTLYEELERGDGVETVTLSEAVETAGPDVVRRIHSGSWIESSFRIWMGHAEDRQGWAALGAARQAVADAERGGSLDPDTAARARRHLYAAEGSDWFWWYGEDFSTDLAVEFDALFRGHVIRAALLAGAAPPQEALEPIKHVGVPAATDAKPQEEPTALLTPTLDGRETGYFEWQGAGVFRPAQHRGSMYGGAQAFEVLRYAFDLEALYLRLDPAGSAARAAEAATGLRVEILGDAKRLLVAFPLVPGAAVHPGRHGGDELGRVAFGRIAELALPFAPLGLLPGEKIAMALHVVRGDVEVERLPRFGYLGLAVPDPDFERVHWRV